MQDRKGAGMARRHVRAQKSERGQGFIELGLSLIFLIMLLSAVIDLGWAFFTLIALRDTAQEAATVGSICPTNFIKVRARLKEAATSPVDTSKLNDNQIEFRIFKIDNSGVRTDVCTFDTAHTSNCPASSFEIGDSFEVKVTYMHEIVTPLVGTFIGSQQYPISVTAVDTILKDSCSIN